MDHCKRRLGEDSDDYNYYRKLFEKGYVYISVDGNNRTKCVRRFIDNEFSLIKLPHKIPDIEYDSYKNWNPKKNDRSFETLPRYIRDHLKERQTWFSTIIPCSTYR